MKRYLIFAAICPLIGGLLMLFATTVASGYWTDTNWSEFGKFVGAFVKTLQYSYLFGIVPALMIGAIDDILFHVKRIRPVLRMLIVGAIGFAASELLYGSRGPDTGALQFFPVRHRRHGADHDLVLAGAQIRRRARRFRCVRRSASLSVVPANAGTHRRAGCVSERRCSTASFQRPKPVVMGPCFRTRVSTHFRWLWQRR